MAPLDASPPPPSERPLRVRAVICTAPILLALRGRGLGSWLMMTHSGLGGEGADTAPLRTRCIVSLAYGSRHSDPLECDEQVRSTLRARLYVRGGASGPERVCSNEPRSEIQLYSGAE